MLCEHCHTNKRERHRTICGTCRTRKYRAKYPVKASFDNLKHNAKRRKKDFDLTIDQFGKIAVETEYIIKKGRSKSSYSLDRIENDKGYTISNIQVMTVSNNSKKHTKKVEYDWVNREFYTVTLPTAQTSEEDCPF